MTALTPEIAATLGVTLLALALFIGSRLPVEVVSLIVMSILIVTGLVSVQTGLAGFANEATVTVALMLALSIGLVRTGVIDRIGRWTARVAGNSELRLMVIVLLVVIPTSAFMSNTAVVVILVPAVLGLTRRSGIAPSRILLPLSFASQLGGTTTLIGTSTNLLVAGLALDLGVGRIGLFDVTPPALGLTAVGVLYLLTLGRWLTPVRATSEDLVERYELHDYLTGLIVEHGSRLADRSLAETRFGEEYGLHVVAVEREGERLPAPAGSTVLREHDLLLVEGKIPDIARVQETEGLTLAEDIPEIVPVELRDDTGGRSRERAQLAEAMVPPRSSIVGLSLRELAFQARSGVGALAIQRRGHPLHEEVGNVRLEAGDLLLVQGTPAALQELHQGREMLLLGPVNLPPKRQRKMRVAVAIMVGVIALPALGITTIVLSALLGVLAMFLTGCLTPREVYEEMDWSVVILLGGILPLGFAMQQSGTAEWLAVVLLQLTEPYGAYGSLAAMLVVTTGLTAVISNAAAAVVLTPMAIAASGALGTSPLPFVIAVMLAASNSFLTPIGYQTNLFVYGPGGYRFGDFVRVGAPLSLLMIAAATVLIPFFFPFDAP